MTDRNLEYDYASKQRTSIGNMYQQYNLALDVVPREAAVDFSAYTAGEALDVSGLDIFRGYYDDDSVSEMFVATERDSVITMAHQQDDGTAKFADLFMVGSNAEIKGIPLSGVVDVWVRLYLKNASIRVGVYGPWYYLGYTYIEFDELGASGDRGLRYQASAPNYGSDSLFTESATATSPGWWNFRLRLDFDTPSVHMRAWSGAFSSEPVTWDIEHTSIADDRLKLEGGVPYLRVRPSNVLDYAAEVAEFGVAVVS